MLGGGFPRGRLILVIGEPGAGKTVLCSQVLYNGITRFGETGLFVSLKETRAEFLREMNSFGWDFASAEKEGKFSFVDASPIRTIPGEVKIGQLTVGNPDFSLISLLEVIRKSAKAINALRIVFDSIATLDFVYMDEAQRRKAILDLVEALSETGATCLLTSDLSSIGMGGILEFNKYLRNSLVQLEKHMFHGTIVMDNLLQGRTLERVITVEKMRETQIDRQPRPYRITEKGIEVYPQRASRLNSRTSKEY